MTLSAAGDIPTGRYRCSHLGGDSPRELFKLMRSRLELMIAEE